LLIGLVDGLLKTLTCENAEVALDEVYPRSMSRGVVKPNSGVRLQPLLGCNTGSERTTVNGWTSWRSLSGTPLADLQTQYLASQG